MVLLTTLTRRRPAQEVAPMTFDQPISWAFAAAVTVGSGALYVRARHARFAADRRQNLGKPAKSGLTYGQSVQKANAVAARYLLGALIIIPVFLGLLYAFASGIPFINRELLIGVLNVAGTFTVLIGVFVAIREGVLRLTLNSGKG